jgi:hypothetical protein
MAGVDDDEKLGNVNFPLDTETAAYLDDLIRTGLYGKNRTTVARALVARGIEHFIDSGRIKQREFPPVQTPGRSG